MAGQSVGKQAEITIQDARLAMETQLQARSPNYYDGSRLCIVRCFVCDSENGRENYGPAVASGECAHCGWPKKKISHPKATRQARIDWLLAHQTLWEGWPSGNFPREIPTRKWITIVDAMREAGLVSAKTNWRDVNLTNLIHDARRQRRMGGRKTGP